MDELKKLIKGKWEYNIEESKLLCKNKDGVMYIFEYANLSYFQDFLSTLKSRGTPNPELCVKYDEPVFPVSLEEFHRILRANEILYEQTVALKQGQHGLSCDSKFTTYELNHCKYDEEKQIFIDPQMVCKITRKIRDRQRVITHIRLEEKRLILRCEFSYVILTMFLPTVNGRWKQ